MFQADGWRHICDERYTDKDVRVRDHCQITGKFRGSAHQECNLKLRIKSEDIKIPVIFHNLQGYDSHCIMQQVGEIAKNHAYENKKGEEKINAISSNMEKYMAFMLGNHYLNFNFIDSFQFMSSSLNKFVSNLSKEAFKYTSEEFTGNKLNLMSQKVRIHMITWIVLKSSIKRNCQLKSSFIAFIMTNTWEYDHARKVWKTFDIKTMGECHDLYHKSDLLSPADMFESFRKTCLQYYKLDPCHYFTGPSLSWHAMLKMTNIKLELMTNVGMFQFIKKGMRGGVSYIANRYGKTNKQVHEKIMIRTRNRSISCISTPITCTAGQ